MKIGFLIPVGIVGAIVIGFALFAYDVSNMLPTGVLVTDIPVGSDFP